MGTNILLIRRKVTDRGSFIARMLWSRGWEAGERTDCAIEPGMADVLWIIGNINWFPLVRRSLVSLKAASRPFVIVWHTEPLPLPAAAGLGTARPSLRELAKIVTRDPRATDMRTNAVRLRRMWRAGIPDLLVVSTGSRQEYLAEQGIDSHFVPMGYHESMGRDLGMARDIDAMFLGAMTDPGHRRRVRRLRKCGVNLVATGGWSRQTRLWGDERTEAINRTLTFLALQRHPGKLSGVRMLLGMANRSLVIAEPIHHPAPYVPGKHYVSVPLGDMPDAISHYLANERERAEIATAGHEFVTKELIMEKSIERVIELAGLC